jgi:hypothetical protein
LIDSAGGGSAYHSIRSGTAMRKVLLLCLPWVLLLTSGLTGEEEKKEKKVLKNADIVVMTQNHFDDETLIKIIEVSETDFDVSGDALIAMKNQGVSSAVLRAMLESVHKKRVASQPAPELASTPTTVAPATVSAPVPATVPAPAEKSDPSGFPARSTSVVPGDNAAHSTGSAREPTAAGSAGMSGPNGAMGINPQQLAALQAQMAAMEVAGMGMGGMGMGGMLGSGMFSMSYSAEQMPHVFLMLRANQGKQEISPSIAHIGQTKYRGNVDAAGMALRSLATEGPELRSHGRRPCRHDGDVRVFHGLRLHRECVRVRPASLIFGGFPDGSPLESLAIPTLRRTIIDLSAPHK